MTARIVPCLTEIVHRDEDAHIALSSWRACDTMPASIVGDDREGAVLVARVYGMFVLAFPRGLTSKVLWLAHICNGWFAHGPERAFRERRKSDVFGSCRFAHALAVSYIARTGTEEWNRMMRDLLVDEMRKGGTPVPSEPIATIDGGVNHADQIGEPIRTDVFLGDTTFARIADRMAWELVPTVREWWSGTWIEHVTDAIAHRSAGTA